MLSLFRKIEDLSEWVPCFKDLFDFCYISVFASIFSNESKGWDFYVTIQVVN